MTAIPGPQHHGMSFVSGTLDAFLLQIIYRRGPRHVKDPHIQLRTSLSGGDPS
jgi:hypothetical protein